MLDPNLVVRLHARVGIGTIGDDRLIAAALRASLAGLDRIGDHRVEIRLAVRDHRESDGARDGDLFVLDPRLVLLQPGNELFAPDIHVALVAALQQSQELHSAHAPDDLLGVQGVFQNLRELDQNLFARGDADVALDRGELVELDQREVTHATSGGAGESLGQRLEQLAPVQESRGGIRADGFRDVRCHLALVPLASGHDQAHTGLSFVLTQGEHDLHRQHRAVGEQSAHLEGVIAPPALQAGGQRALQGGLVGLIEQVHHRLADQAVEAPEQLGPGGIGVDDDAFLNLHDGVVRSLQHGLELASGIARRLDGRIQRPLQSERAQLAQHDGIEACRAGQGNQVTGSREQRLRNQGFGGRFFAECVRKDEHRHAGGDLIPNGDRRLQLDVSGGHVNQQLRIDLGQGVCQVARLRNPGAMNRMARAAQGAVDRLDGIARGAEDDQRDRILLGQTASRSIAHKNDRAGITRRSRASPSGPPYRALSEILAPASPGPVCGVSQLERQFPGRRAGRPTLAGAPGTSRTRRGTR